MGGIALTNGQITSAGMTRKKKKYIKVNNTLSRYIKQKVKFLTQFCIVVTDSFFDGCESEIAVDNKARDLILSR